MRTYDFSWGLNVKKLTLRASIISVWVFFQSAFSPNLSGLTSFKQLFKLVKLKCQEFWLFKKGITCRKWCQECSILSYNLKVFSLCSLDSLLPYVELFPLFRVCLGAYLQSSTTNVIHWFNAMKMEWNLCWFFSCFVLAVHVFLNSFSSKTYRCQCYRLLFMAILIAFWQLSSCLFHLICVVICKCSRLKSANNSNIFLACPGPGKEKSMDNCFRETLLTSLCLSMRSLANFRVHTSHMTRSANGQQKNISTRVLNCCWEFFYFCDLNR